MNIEKLSFFLPLDFSIVLVGLVILLDLAHQAIDLLSTVVQSFNFLAVTGFIKNYLKTVFD
jgi:hypothetical protein